MRKLIRWLALASGVALFSGCAWVPQTAKLKLTPQIATSDVGNSTKVAVTVTDRRPSQVLGYRGLDTQNAKITTAQDVAFLFREKIVEGLLRMGFNPVPDGDDAIPLLKIEIQQIDYKTDLDFWKGSAMAKAVLRASARKNGLGFDQLYTGERRETVAEAPGAKVNQRLINGAITEAVQKLFTDDRLTTFLAN